MDLKRLLRRAKTSVDDRGGMDALKQDARELADVAEGKGSLPDKAKAAGEALKDPGAPGGEARGGGAQRKRGAPPAGG